MNAKYTTTRKAKIAIVMLLLLAAWHLVSKKSGDKEFAEVLPANDVVAVDAPKPAVASPAMKVDQVSTSVDSTRDVKTYPIEANSNDYVSSGIPATVTEDNGNSQPMPIYGDMVKTADETNVTRLPPTGNIARRVQSRRQERGISTAFSESNTTSHVTTGDENQFTPIPNRSQTSEQSDFVASNRIEAPVAAVTNSELVATVPESLPSQASAPTNDFANLTHPADTHVTVPHVTSDQSDVQTVALTTSSLPPRDGPATATQGTTEYILAAQPKIGDRYKSETPVFDRLACESPVSFHDFSPDAIDPNHPYDPYLNQQVYEGKTLNANQRPLLELGQPWYQLGQLSPGSSLLGHHNNLNPQFLIFGDYRQAYASNTVNADNVSQVAFQLNTFWSLFLTGTERLVTGVSPLTQGGDNTRILLDDDVIELETDFDFDFGYLEGDLGGITGGFVNKTLPFDLPFSVGLTPIFVQNGIWINDALEGIFLTLPARNSPRFNISNMDITFAFIYDQIDSAAFHGDNSAAKAYAFFFFIEALNGYIEADYAFLEDRDVLDRSYHNIALAYTRRFGRFISHSTRVIANAGQEVSAGDQTADGVLLLSENSLITRHPYTVIPYFNFFAGFDTPQSFAGDQELTNTGILFESDNLTGFPTLDVRAQDTFGYAVGLNLLAQDFSQQLILETAAVFRGDDSDLAGDQFGVGMRYQLPVSNSWIFRTDGMYGFFRGDDDDFGVRVEMRKKF